MSCFTAHHPFADWSAHSLARNRSSRQWYQHDIPRTSDSTYDIHTCTRLPVVRTTRHGCDVNRNDKAHLYGNPNKPNRCLALGRKAPRMTTYQGRHSATTPCSSIRTRPRPLVGPSLRPARPARDWKPQIHLLAMHSTDRPELQTGRPSIPIWHTWAVNDLFLQGFWLHRILVKGTGLPLCPRPAEPTLIGLQSAVTDRAFEGEIP